MWRTQSFLVRGIGMRRWLGVVAIALSVGLGAPASAQAVFFSASPTIAQPDTADFSPVTFEFFFHADGHTAGVSAVDLYLDLSDPTRYATINPTTVGNSTLGAGASVVDPDTVIFTASDVTSLLPTPTGTEVLKLGELEIVHAGIDGPLNLMVNTDQVIIFDTLNFDTELTPTNAPFEIIATLDVGATIIIVPEPSPIGLMLASMLGIWALRRLA